MQIKVIVNEERERRRERELDFIQLELFHCFTMHIYCVICKKCSKKYYFILTINNICTEN